MKHGDRVKDARLTFIKSPFDKERAGIIISILRDKAFVLWNDPVDCEEVSIDDIRLYDAI